MTTPIPTRFSEEEMAVIDRLVAQGIGENRSDLIRRAVAHFAETVRRARTGDAIAQSYRRQPQSPDDDNLAMASAVALTEAEPW